MSSKSRRSCTQTLAQALRLRVNRPIMRSHESISSVTLKQPTPIAIWRDFSTSLIQKTRHCKYVSINGQNGVISRDERNRRHQEQFTTQDASKCTLTEKWLPLILLSGPGSNMRLRSKNLKATQSSLRLKLGIHASPNSNSSQIVRQRGIIRTVRTHISTQLKSSSSVGSRTTMIAETLSKQFFPRQTIAIRVKKSILNAWANRIEHRSSTTCLRSRDKRWKRLHLFLP